eukprot:3494717-Lingulodinium_polyedra.AAC.2
MSASSVMPSSASVFARERSTDLCRSPVKRTVCSLSLWKCRMSFKFPLNWMNSARPLLLNFFAMVYLALSSVPAIVVAACLLVWCDRHRVAASVHKHLQQEWCDQHRVAASVHKHLQQECVWFGVVWPLGPVEVLP